MLYPSFLSIIVIVSNFCFIKAQDGTCEKSLTTVSGIYAPKKFCSGDLIFEDDFDTLNFKTWQHENTLSGGGNWEFEWYTNNRSNSYAKDGHLYIKPTLTADLMGEENLSRMTLDISGSTLADYCTDMRFWGCLRTGTQTHILNPIRSAKITTMKSFSFKYGKLAAKVKLPTGDWLWPAIWLLPRYNVYGPWPTSGEIDLLESRGNKKLKINDEKIGVERVSSTLHWGPTYNTNKYQATSFIKNSPGGNNEFRLYELEWTPEYIKFSLDGEILGTVEAQSFWDLGNFTSSGLSNPWEYGSKIAPFDDEFFIIINLAVGGTNGYFPDGTTPKKPWENKSPHALSDFWKNRATWLPSWKLDENNGETAALQVDYIKVWAL